MNSYGLFFFIDLQASLLRQCRVDRRFGIRRRRERERERKMSVYGGDSWAREAQQRKRRVDDLVSNGLDAISYKKLSNGKYACLVCPNNPVFDTSLMLSMHCKGARHSKAASKLKDKEQRRQNEITKRIALMDSSITTATSSNLKSASKPLIIEQTRKATTDILHSKTPSRGSSSEKVNVETSREDMNGNVSGNNSCLVLLTSEKASVELPLEFRERRERELKFTAAGWKRDGHGKWYKDENVEFDSDEEDPNVCLK